MWSSKAGFLNLGSVNIWGQINLCCGGLFWALECLAAFLASTH